MAYSKQEREQYNQYRLSICNRLGIRELDYNAFKRYGNKLRNIYCKNCNGDYEDGVQYINAYMPIESLAINLAKRLNLNIFFQTDPRGGTIYLSTEPIPENNYTIASLVY